jgi:ABC-2 type transport system permease protein
MSPEKGVNKAWRIATKELLQTRRDKLAAIFTIILPIVFTIFLGMIIGNQSGDPNIPVAVADLDGTAVSQRFVEQLDASPLLKVKAMAQDELDAAVQDQKTAAALVIPKGFGDAAGGAGSQVVLTLIRVETSSGAQTVVQTIQTAVAELNTRVLAVKVVVEQVSAAGGSSGGTDLATSAEALVTTAMASPAVSATTVEANAAESSAVQGAGGFTIASTGSLVQWVLFSLLTVSTGVAWERRSGLLRRLAATGVSGRTIIEGKMMAMVIITFLQQVMLVLLGALAFDVGYFNSVGALLMVMVSLSVLASCVGLLISALFRSEPPVIATTVITAQMLALLGGAWFPLEVTGTGFSRVAHFFPSAWIMDSLHGIVLKDWGAGDILMPLGIVWAWIIVILAVAVWRFRPE